MNYVIEQERLRQADRKWLCRMAKKRTLRGMALLEQYAGSFGAEHKRQMKERVTDWSYYERLTQIRCWLKEQVKQGRI